MKARWSGWLAEVLYTMQEGNKWEKLVEARPLSNLVWIWLSPSHCPF